MSETTKIAVIVGGSLAGLMNAIVFRNLKYKVYVLERSESRALESEAAGIRAGPEVHDFIEQHVVNYDPDYVITADNVEIMDAKGDVTTKFPPKDPLRLTTWKAVYDMLKGALLNDSNATPPAAYQTRQLVQDIRQDGEKLLVLSRDLDANTSQTVEADLVIAADGAHSAIRKMFYPSMSPQYAGYVSWRGRVPETAVSTSTRGALQNRCVILRVHGGYQISYYVPAEGSDPDSKQRDFVWIWYDMLPEDSPQFDETLTDVDGKKHNTTIPRGKMQPKVWQRLLDRRDSVSNPYFIELMEKIKEPFVSAIRDFEGSKAVFFEGKLLLAGDALAQCRPHGGASTSQAALQAELLAKVWNGEMTLEEWEEMCFQSAAKAAQHSLAMAQFFWNGKVTAVSKKTIEPDSQ